MRWRCCSLLAVYRVLRFASRVLLVVAAFLLRFWHRLQFLAPSLQLLFAPQYHFVVLSMLFVAATVCPQRLL